MTEKKPFTAHPHATNSRLWSVVPAIVTRPIGMNAPRVKPSGAIIATAIAQRTTSDDPTKRPDDVAETELVEENQKRQYAEQRDQSAVPPRPVDIGRQAADTREDQQRK